MERMTHIDSYRVIKWWLMWATRWLRYSPPKGAISFHCSNANVAMDISDIWPQWFILQQMAFMTLPTNKSKIISHYDKMFVKSKAVFKRAYSRSNFYVSPNYHPHCSSCLGLLCCFLFVIGPIVQSSQFLGWTLKPTKPARF